MPKHFKPKIISANDLLVGDVIYLNAAGDWTRLLSEARVIDTKEEADRLIGIANAQQEKAVGPYLVDISLDDDGLPFPSHFREKYRNLGPSNRKDLGRQSEYPYRKVPLAAGSSI